MSDLIYTHCYGEESYGLVYENINNDIIDYDVFSATYGGTEMYECTFTSKDMAIEYSKSFI